MLHLITESYTIFRLYVAIIFVIEIEQDEQNNGC